MTNQTEGQEQRITKRLMAYWHEHKGTKLLPRDSDINPAALQDVWDDCFVVEVKMDASPGDEFRYSYLGPSIIAAYGDNVTGADIQTSMLSPSGGHVTDIFEKVIETKKPIIQESEFLNAHKILVRYRQCVLPFGDGDGNVTRLLGGVRWGTF